MDLLNLSSSLKCLFDFVQTDDRLVSGQIHLKEIDVKRSLQTNQLMIKMFQ